MSAALHLVRTRIDTRALNILAAHTGTLDDDLGYALHLALRRRFGAAAPQPFRLLEPERNRSYHPRLLGYTTEPAALDLPPALPDPDADWAENPNLADIFPEPFEAKAMPSDWPEGIRLRFEVLARPVRRHGPMARAARDTEGRTDGLGRPLRTGKGKSGKASVELDAYELAVEALGRDDPKQTRAEVYADWMAERLGIAAKLDGVPELARFRRSRVLRRSSPQTGSKNRAGRERGGHGVEGPEALLSGMLQVVDGPAFTELLARGVGRHRAFGLGMLLLRPA